MVRRIRPGKPFYGRQYCADTSTNLVHDLLQEKPNCGIDNINPDFIRMFTDLDEAKKNGFNSCNHCLWIERKI